ncbi:hypothetical protein Trydic_g10838 [Trypoxylus dichotomus]
MSEFCEIKFSDGRGSSTAASPSVCLLILRRLRRSGRPVLSGKVPDRQVGPDRAMSRKRVNLGLRERRLTRHDIHCFALEIHDCDGNR